MPSDLVPSDYTAWLTDLKARIHQAQQRATLSVNRELIALYWQLGKDILTRQAEQGWGAKVIERLSRDLRAAFPEMKGFSRANLLYMRAFAEAWTDPSIVQQAVGQLPWGHNIVLLTRLKAPEWRLTYARQAIAHGWSRNVLNIHIETQRLEREGKAVTNFELLLPQPQSDLARESLKDPYRLDFLGLGKEAEERAIESALVHFQTLSHKDATRQLHHAIQEGKIQPFIIHPSNFILFTTLGSTLSNDPLSDKRFDFQFVNPPYGYERSKDYDAVTTREPMQNNPSVRQRLGQRGLKQETLPPQLSSSFSLVTFQRGQLLSTTQIPVCLWFDVRDKQADEAFAPPANPALFEAVAFGGFETRV